MSNLEHFISKFKVDSLLIFESKYWTWSVRPVQPTIGSGILALKRHAESFSEINAEESKDIAVIVKVIEERLKKHFDYDKINYLMLMMVDLHVHFHIIPRYSKMIEFGGINWVDKGWPALPVLEAEDIEEEKLVLIKNKLISI